MIYWDIFSAFFISNLLGYGGGPSTIPLIQKEVVGHYHWMSLEQFGDLFAIANILPGPIATKMAGYIGYQIGGIPGMLIALVATIAPSAIAVIILFSFANRFKNALQVKWMTKSVQPVIAVLLGVLAYQFFLSSYENSGIIHLLILALGSLVALEKFKVHPAFVILFSLLYGGVFLSGVV
ncbi:chromate transporter [Pseudalkalibacillus decolorationis]|uniref:chromate transporter n=1 Tax=Pseudalkalibacillus decolorationis TaxID=163879 RepID=UPI002148379A|nr:chromate transporter [Pseudalkalibacillus decolorationis]